MLKIYVSELSALINRNPFKTPQEASMEVLRRNNYNLYEKLFLQEQLQVNNQEKEVEEVLRTTKVINCSTPEIIREVAKVTKTLKDNHEKKISNLIEQFPEMKVKDIRRKNPEIKEEIVNKMIYTNRGKHFETENLNTFKKQSREILKNQNTKLFSRSINEEIILMGRTDATTDNQVIETKNRQKRLFKELREYEKVQIYGYMYITELNSAKLIENFNKEQNVIEVTFEEEYFDEIKEDLISYKHNIYDKFRYNEIVIN